MVESVDSGRASKIAQNRVKTIPTLPVKRRRGSSRNSCPHIADLRALQQKETLLELRDVDSGSKLSPLLEPVPREKDL